MKNFLKHLLYWGSFKLRNYEQACLDHWKSKLPPEAVALLNQQLKQLNYIQRCLDDKLVVFYCFDDLKFQHWPRELSFPIGGEERRVFRMKLKASCNNKTKTIKAEVVLYEGRFSSLEFNVSPTICKTGFEIIESEVLMDPMLQNVQLPPRIITRAELPDWLKEIVQDSSITIRNALPVEYREKLIKQIDAALPSDYLKFIELFDGLDSNEFYIHGLSTVKLYPRQDHYCFVLADISWRGHIGVLAESRDTMLYYIDNETDEIENMGTSLLNAIQQKLK